MPLRSLTSSVLKWPDRETVDAAARKWALEQAARHPQLERLGYFGSYARGSSWGVGSDLDLIAIVTDDPAPFERRLLGWELGDLPVPAEILVYTTPEWARLLRQGGRFAEMLRQDTVWLYPRTD
jgi:hypothetical protein